MAMKRVGKLSYDPQRIIGEGSGGTIVFYGIYHEEDVDKPVAVKRIQRLMNHAEESTIQQEKKLMETTVNHVNILRYLWTERDDYFWFMATELCSGTLEEYLNGKYVGPRFLNELEILHQVVQGLAHLHRLGIVHRDIKPTNILIFVPSVDGDETNKPLVKLADFGISKILKIGKNDFTNTSVTNPNGTRGWMAPEVYESNRFDFKVDIFSLGCVFAYILTGGKHPFGDNVNERVLRISRKERMLVVKKDFRNGEAFKLIQSMLEMEPSKRPKAGDILKKCSFFLCNRDRTRQLLDLCGSSDLTDDKAIQIKQLMNDPTVYIHAVAEDEWTPLHLLCLSSHHQNQNWNTLVRLFVEKYADLDARVEGGLTPLHLLCSLQEIKSHVVDVVLFLIENGAEVNARDRNGRTPLYFLYKYYQKDSFKGTLHQLLLQKGADVNAKDEYGWTPLHCACKYCKIDSLIDIVKLCTEKGADVNAKDQTDGSTPLHELLGRCNYNYKNDDLKNVIQLLIEKGADVNIKNDFGNTPLLSLLCRYRRERGIIINDNMMDIVQFLIQNGADANVKDQNGNSPSDYLKESKREASNFLNKNDPKKVLILLCVLCFLLISSLVGIVNLYYFNKNTGKIDLND